MQHSALRALQRSKATSLGTADIPDQTGLRAKQPHHWVIGLDPRHRHEYCVNRRHAHLHPFRVSGTPALCDWADMFGPFRAELKTSLRSQMLQIEFKTCVATNARGERGTAMRTRAPFTHAKGSNPATIVFHSRQNLLIFLQSKIQNIHAKRGSSCPNNWPKSAHFMQP